MTGLQTLGGGSIDEAPGANTPTAAAFDLAARRAAQMHPELFADSDSNGLAEYVVAAPSPVNRHDGHIQDD